MHELRNNFIVNINKKNVTIPAYTQNTQDVDENWNPIPFISFCVRAKKTCSYEDMSKDTLKHTYIHTARNEKKKRLNVLCLKKKKSSHIMNTANENLTQMKNTHTHTQNT